MERRLHSTSPSLQRESHGQQELVQIARLEAKLRVDIEFTSWMNIFTFNNFLGNWQPRPRHKFELEAFYF